MMVKMQEVFTNYSLALVYLRNIFITGCQTPITSIYMPYLCRHDISRNCGAVDKDLCSFYPCQTVVVVV